VKDKAQDIEPIRPRRKGSARRRKLRRLRRNFFVAFFIDLIVVLGAALVLSLVIKTFLIRSFFIPSGSMLETLQIDDRIIVNQLTPALYPIERGDVVVFKDPGGWLGPDFDEPTDPVVVTVDWFLSAFGITAPDSKLHLVKRVIGTEGDRVICCDADGLITVNGVAISETDYVAPGQAPSSIEFDVTVPRNSLWVLGDNRGNSEDSRFHGDLPSKGFVSNDWVVGRAFVISWPFENWKLLDNYPDVFKNVPDPSN
jgi:signal peptidase I